MRAAAETRALVLFSSLYVQEASTRSAAVEDLRIRRALELLQQAHVPALSLVARTTNLSVSRFRHLFKKQLGVSPVQYVKTLRLQHARSLLQTSFLTVKEITRVVGVNDVSHFVRDYKTQFAETPMETRLLASSKKPPSRAQSVAVSANE